MSRFQDTLQKANKRARSKLAIMNKYLFFKMSHNQDNLLKTKKARSKLIILQLFLFHKIMR